MIDNACYVSYFVFAPVQDDVLRRRESENGRVICDCKDGGTRLSMDLHSSNNDIYILYSYVSVRLVECLG